MPTPAKDNGFEKHVFTVSAKALRAFRKRFMREREKKKMNRTTTTTTTNKQTNKRKNQEDDLLFIFQRQG